MNNAEIKFYDSLSGKKKVFNHEKSKPVLMYSCGPTVYDYPHIGNYRSFLFSDLVHRFLKFMGYNVKLVMNITDIDDKTIKLANKKNITLEAFTSKYTEAFHKDLQALNVRTNEVTYPKATDYIKEMIEMIQDLIKKGYAYQADGSVYFKIETFKEYGKLSKIKVEEQLAGASNRIDNDEYEKESVNDFVLWKGYQENDGEVYFDSPFGRGRPGWHIECSAMSKACLGEQIDIHTGGIDNKFPHHENEIAQSECSHGKTFSKFWMHVAHLKVNDEKMSKSLGNFYTLKHLLDEGYDPSVIRYMLLSCHYRNNYNFKIEDIEANAKAVEKVNFLIEKLKVAFDGGVSNFLNATKERENKTLEIVKKNLQGFIQALSDDFNISEALSFVF